MARIDREDADAIYVRVYDSIVVDATAAEPTATPHAELKVSNYFTSRPFDQGLPREAQWRNELAVADIDADGELDIVSTPPRKSLSAPVIFRGDGAGNWSRWAAPKLPKLGYDYGSVAVADVDRDGRADLALAMHLRGFTVLRQGADGQFERMDAGLPQIEAMDQHGVSGTALALADSSAGIQLLLLDERMRPATIPGRRPPLLAFRWQQGQWQAVDLPEALQRSTQVQLVSADRSMPGVWLLLPSDAGWQAARLLDGQWTMHPINAPGACQPFAAAVAEVDGDGKPDFALSCQRLLTQQWWSQVELLRSASGPLTLQAGSAAETIKRLRFFQADTLRSDNHGAPNLAMLGEDGVLTLLAAASHGTYTRDHQEPVAQWRAGCRGFDLHSVDLDHDGSDELIASFAGESSVFEGGPGCRGGGGISGWKLARP
jgi:hypothetical protein